jgi:hypothetical protein
VMLKIKHDTPVRAGFFSPRGKIIETLTVDDDVRAYNFWGAN